MSPLPAATMERQDPSARRTPARGPRCPAVLRRRQRALGTPRIRNAAVAFPCFDRRPIRRLLVLEISRARHVRPHIGDIGAAIRFDSQRFDVRHARISPQRQANGKALAWAKKLPGRGWNEDQRHANVEIANSGGLELWATQRRST